MANIIFGPVNVMDIVEREDILAKGVPGGDGLWAWQGAKLVSEDNLLLSGIGSDFDKYFGEWAVNNDFNRAGLILRTDYSNYCKASPKDSFLSFESSIYGEEAGRFYYAENTLFPQQFTEYLWNVGKIILCELPEIVSIKALKNFRPTEKVPICCIFPERTISLSEDGFINRIELLDSYALDSEIAGMLFGIQDEKMISNKLKSFGKPFCMTGRKSLYAYNGNECIELPYINYIGSELGCRQTASATVLTLFDLNTDLKECCEKGILAYKLAGMNYGLIPDIKAAARMFI